MSKIILFFTLIGSASAFAQPGIDEIIPIRLDQITTIVETHASHLSLEKKMQMYNELTETISVLKEIVKVKEISNQ